MTDVDDEEQRLRERLKAKSAQKRREQANSPPEATAAPSPSSRESERSMANRERRSSSQQNRGSRSRSSSRDRRDFHRNGGNNYHGRGRRYDSHYEDRSNYYDRRGPPAGRDYYDRSRGRDRRDMDYRGRDDDRYYRSDSRSSGRDRDHRQDHFGRDEGWRRRRSRSASRSRSYSSDSRSRRSSSVSSRSSASDSSVSSAESQKGKADNHDNTYTKDQRTVFVTQLVQRATERDLKKYFSKQHNIKVNDVILLRDKRTGRHKGCAYIELRKMEDISKALTLSNSAPTFQRFPILIKASEAEKNHAAALQGASKAATSVATNPPTQTQTLPPLLGPNGKLLESQQVYVGSLDPSVTHEHLYCVFFHFGSLQKVSIQTDSSTGISKGFAFLKFHDPKEANLAIQTMANQVLMGRPLKTGWATNQIPSIPGAEVVTSTEFPPDASVRATNAYKVLGQLTLGVTVSQIKQSLVASSTSTGSTIASGAPALVAAEFPASAIGATATTTGGASRVPTVAEARASLAGAANSMQAPVQAMPVIAAPVAIPVAAQPAALPVPSGGPTCHVLIHNMFDKDQETEPGWEKEIKEEFEEEATKFGKIVKVTVMSQEIGGKIYCTFESVVAAQNCATALSGRWFDRRQLRTEFMQESDLPQES